MLTESEQKEYIRLSQAWLLSADDRKRQLELERKMHRAERGLEPICTR